MDCVSRVKGRLHSIEKPKLYRIPYMHRESLHKRDMLCWMNGLFSNTVFWRTPSCSEGGWRSEGSNARYEFSSLYYFLYVVEILAQGKHFTGLTVSPSTYCFEGNSHARNNIWGEVEEAVYQIWLFKFCVGVNALRTLAIWKHCAWSVVPVHNCSTMTDTTE